MRDLSDQLDQYRRDHERITGTPFKHFHCPILGVDEPTEMCRGLVIPIALKAL
jgi:hypothetical protein